MLDEMRYARTEILPSKYWEYLNESIEEKLKTYGLENFKRTYNAHYFGFFPSPFSRDIDHLRKNLPI